MQPSRRSTARRQRSHGIKALCLARTATYSRLQLQEVLWTVCLSGMLVDYERPMQNEPRLLPAPSAVPSRPRSIPKHLNKDEIEGLCWLMVEVRSASDILRSFLDNFCRQKCSRPTSHTKPTSPYDMPRTMHSVREYNPHHQDAHECWNHSCNHTHLGSMTTGALTWLDAVVSPCDANTWQR